MPGVSRRSTSFERAARLAADHVGGWWDAVARARRGVDFPMVVPELRGWRPGASELASIREMPLPGRPCESDVTTCFAGSIPQPEGVYDGAGAAAIPCFRADRRRHRILRSLKRIRSTRSACCRRTISPIVFSSNASRGVFTTDRRLRDRRHGYPIGDQILPDQLDRPRRAPVVSAGVLPRSGSSGLHTSLFALKPSAYVRETRRCNRNR
jgi:hypothetical protein